MVGSEKELSARVFSWWAESEEAKQAWRILRPGPFPAGRGSPEMDGPESLP